VKEDDPIWHRRIERRDFVRMAGTAGLVAGARSLLPRYALGAPLPPRLPSARAGNSGRATNYDLVIAETPLNVASRRGSAVTINGTVPGPLLRFREGEETVLRVTNRLREDTSIHWHGVLVPPAMDGVPGVSFPGIRPGETFEYRFRLKQYGTYWYHSHSGLQEQLGHYGPLLIEPAGGHPYKFDREYVLVLSDWTFENPYRVLDRLKKQGNYYNVQRRTVGDFFRDVKQNGFGATLRERLMWLDMRMDPTDIMDVSGATYHYLLNGLAPGDNWTGVFNPGERVLLHIINAAADSYFDVRIPELPMSVVQVSGQNVEPVETDEIRVAIDETYSVIIEPQNRPYALFAESMDRTGFAAGTLTPRAGWNAPLPPRRKRPLLAMSDMGMSHGNMDMAGMDAGNSAMAGMPGTDHSKMAMPDTAAARPTTAPTPPAAPAAGAHAGHGGAPAATTTTAPTGATPTGGDLAKYAIAGMTRTRGMRPPGTLPGMLEHEPGRHGVDNAAVPMIVTSRLGEPGVGLGGDGWRVLLYTQLRSLEAPKIFRAPTREIELHLTGNMERFMWSIDGTPFERAEPVRLNYGERIRLTMVNDTMMNHPMHLHGMFMELENGQGNRIPRIHTVNVKPAERLSLLIEVDEPGRWAFHCHILYHMEVGMFRVFEVSEPGKPFAIEGVGA
jgi:CopA family copper-resistance protein